MYGNKQQNLSDKMFVGSQAKNVPIASELLIGRLARSAKLYLGWRVISFSYNWVKPSL